MKTKFGLRKGGYYFIIMLFVFVLLSKFAFACGNDSTFYIIFPSLISGSVLVVFIIFSIIIINNNKKTKDEEKPINNKRHKIFYGICFLFFLLFIVGIFVSYNNYEEKAWYQQCLEKCEHDPSCMGCVEPGC